MKSYVFSLLFLFATLPALAQDTFSIVAVDPVTGDIGSAGASCVNGASIIWDTWITDIIPGRGGVNSQAWICIPNTNLQNAIQRMEEGYSPQEIIDWLVLNDACSSQGYNPEYRQYGIVDFDMDGNPRAAGWTGSLADDYKEDRQGPTYSIQGNILLDISVIDNMEDNFNNTSGTLADKLMAALQGANFAGADSRCLADGTSSKAAYMVVYHEDDEPGEPYLKLVVPTQPGGTEPIDILQDMYDDFLAVQDFNHNNSIRLSPNPAGHELKINLEIQVNFTELEILDINGKKIFRSGNIDRTQHELVLDVSSYSSGLYFVRMQSEKGTIHAKFVKH